jgi:hypothetical protein
MQCFKENGMEIATFLQITAEQLVEDLFSQIFHNTPSIGTFT